MLGRYLFIFISPQIVSSTLSAAQVELQPLTSSRKSYHLHLQILYKLIEFWDEVSGYSSTWAAHKTDSFHYWLTLEGTEMPQFVKTISK